MAPKKFLYLNPHNLQMGLMWPKGSCRCNSLRVFQRRSPWCTLSLIYFYSTYFMYMSILSVSSHQKRVPDPITEPRGKILVSGQSCWFLTSPIELWKLLFFSTFEVIFFFYNTQGKLVHWGLTLPLFCSLCRPARAGEWVGRVSWLISAQGKCSTELHSHSYFLICFHCPHEHFLNTTGKNQLGTRGAGAHLKSQTQGP